MLALMLCYSDMASTDHGNVINEPAYQCLDYPTSLGVNNSRSDYVPLSNLWHDMNSTQLLTSDNNDTLLFAILNASTVMGAVMASVLSFFAHFGSNVSTTLGTLLTFMSTSPAHLVELDLLLPALICLILALDFALDTRYSRLKWLNTLKIVLLILIIACCNLCLHLFRGF